MDQPRIEANQQLPRVTFIIAHHNYEQYLNDAIQSALNQTYPNIHICVIDDYSDSEDGSILDYTPLRAIMEPLLKDITSIETIQGLQIHHSPKATFIQIADHNHGQAYARNRGMEQCWNDTDVFAILDADDTNHPDKIEKCIKPFLRYPTEIGAVYADTEIYNIDTGTLTNEYREPFDAQRLVQECIVHSGCLISKYALQNVLENGLVFDETMPPCEDYDLWIRIAEKFMIEHIPEILTFVRVHSQNSTNTSTHEHRMSRIQRIHEKRQIRHNGLQTSN